MFRTAYCYEANEGSRKLVRKNAGLNAIDDRIHIFGSAAKGFHREIPSVVLASAVLLVDIEGSEFDLLDESAFMAFQNSVIFIELHEWFFEDGSIRLQKLKEDASATHRLSEMTTGARDLSQFPELDRLSDSDRWLVCSEGRPRRMSWLRLDPWTATSG